MRVFLFLFFAVAFSSLSAQQLKPFDRLSKNDITLDASVGAAGAQLKNPGTTSDAVSVLKDYSSVKEVIIKIPVSRSLEGLTVEAYGVYKNYDNKSVRFEKIDVRKVSGQEYRFVLTADKSVLRIKYQYTSVDQYGHASEGTVDTGRSVSHGEKISGWFARAIFQNEIIGIAGSSPQWQQSAGQPNPVPDGKEN